MPIHHQQIHPRPPYNFEAVLDVYGRFQYPSLDIIEGATYRRVIRWGETLALAEVIHAGTLETPILNLSVHLDEAQPPSQCFEQLQHMLGVHTPHTAFWEMAQTDTTLWPIIEPVYGMPTLRSATVFEALANVIMEQHIAWTNAQKAQRWLVEWGSQFVEYNGQIYYAYPQPEQLAQATLEALKPLKITYGRINLIIQIAQMVVAEQLNLENLATLSPEITYQELLKIKGGGTLDSGGSLGTSLGALYLYSAQRCGFASGGESIFLPNRRSGKCRCIAHDI